MPELLIQDQEHNTGHLMLKFVCPTCGIQLCSKGSSRGGVKCPGCNTHVFSTCFFCLYGSANSVTGRNTCPNGCSYSYPKFVLHPKYLEIGLPSLEES